MGFSTRGRDNHELVSEINVVPFIDIMLVLLIIFMVTTPMMQQGVEVNLPKATTAPLKGSSEQIVISLDKEGKVYLGAGNEVNLEEIGKKVAVIMERRPPDDQKVYIKGDTELNYGAIMDLMAALHNSGVTQIGLVSATPDGPKK